MSTLYGIMCERVLVFATLLHRLVCNLFSLFFFLAREYKIASPFVDG